MIFTKFLMFAMLGAFLYIFFIFFQNIEAPDGVKNAFLLMAAVIPLLGISYTLQNNPYTFKKHFTYVFFYDQKTKKLSDGVEYINPYSNSYFNMFMKLTRGDLEIGDPHENNGTQKMIDIVEHGIVWALTLEFGGRWDYERVIQKHPQGSAIYYQPGEIERTEHITTQAIHSVFSHNPFLNNETKYESFGFHLPPGSTIRSASTIQPRTIVIENKKTRIKINIRATQSSVFQKGIQGIFPRDPENINRYVGLYYDVEIKGELKNRLPISWKEREALVRWHENLGKTLEQFHWEKVKEEIDKDLQEKANELILQSASALKSLSEMKPNGPSSDDYPATPEGVVERFTRLDADGKRLRRSTQGDILYLLSSSETAAGTTVIINNYRIGTGAIRNSTAIVPVEYEELVGLTADNKLFNIGGKRVIHFRLSRNDVWKIDEPLPAPHVHLENAIAHLRHLQEIEPDQREQLESTIQKILEINSGDTTINSGKQK